MAWKAEVVADRTGKWCGNQLRFASQAEAEGYVRDLMMRWTLVVNTRAVESNDPVTHRWVDGELEAL